MTLHRPGRNGWLTLGAVGAAFALYALLPGTGPWVTSVAASARLLYTHRNASPDSRAAALLGEPYRLIRKAMDTPPDSRILIPAGRAFAPVSNVIWCAYYLHPRRMVMEEDLAGSPAGQADYALVYKGSLLPLFGVPADSIRGTETGVYAIPGSAP